MVVYNFSLGFIIPEKDPFCSLSYIANQSLEISGWSCLDHKNHLLAQSLNSGVGGGFPGLGRSASGWRGLRAFAPMVPLPGTFPPRICMAVSFYVIKISAP